MKARVLVSAVVAASFGLGSISSFAQNWEGLGNHAGRDHTASQGAGNERHDGDRRGGDRQVQRQQLQQQQFQRVAPTSADRSYNRAYVQPGYVYTAPRGDWRRGDRLPNDWRWRMRPVSNWGAYNLYAPPSGYGWVQSDTGDYLLVALATGLIANLLMNR